MVYSKKAVDWDNDQAVVAFMTPRESSVSQFARKVVTGGAGGSTLMNNAVGALEGLKSLNFRYVKDPSGASRSQTLDYVQFPRETLKARTGDCDDLTVLYASVLESIGIETAMVLVPGHIFMAFATDARATSAHQISFNSNDYLVDDGRVWIPIEATLIPQGFVKAWSHGAREAARWKKAGKLTLVKTHQAWLNHPPMALPKDDVIVEVKGTALEKAVATSLKALEARNQTFLNKRLKTLSGLSKAKNAKAKGLNAYGTLLAHAGRYDEAKAIFAKGVSRFADEPALAINLANTHLLMGEEVDAAAYLSSVEALDDASLYNNLGLIYFQLGDADQAARAFEAAAEGGSVELAATLGLVFTETRASKAAAAGDSPAEVLERDLQALLMKSMNKKGKGIKKSSAPSKSRFTRALRTGGRRGTPPDIQRRLIDLLVWPKTEGES